VIKHSHQIFIFVTCLFTAAFSYANQESKWVPIGSGDLTIIIPVPSVSEITATSFQDVNSVNINVGSVGATEAFYFRSKDQYGFFSEWQCQTGEQVTQSNNFLVDNDVSQGSRQYEVSACMTGSGCNLSAFQQGTLACSESATSAIIDVVDNSGTRVPVVSDDIHDPTTSVTPAQFRITESGAASYDVPIAVPSGTAGVQPQLALSYSSQGGDGYLGTGWNISGLSSISRCPKSFVHDDEISGVNFTNQDRLCYNGQRLFVTPSTQSNANAKVSDNDYWATDVIYHTEIDGFSKIQPHYQSSVLKGFTVETKSGEIHYFGYTNVANGNSQLGIPLNNAFKDRLNNTDDGRDAFFKGDTIVQARSWSIKAIQDITSNYILFKYHNDPIIGEAYIEEVQYTGNAKTDEAPYAWVRFDYSENKKKRSGWQSGQRVSMTKLMDTVTSYIDGAEYRSYQLDYFESAFLEEKNNLESITECVEQKCLKPLSFEWQKKAAISSSTTWFCPSGSSFTGFTVVSSPSADIIESCIGIPVNDPFKPFGALGDLRTNTGGHDKARIFDFNGDGYADIVYVEGSQWKVKYGPSFGSAKTLYAGGTEKPENALILDYNGDSVLDLLVANKTPARWVVLSNDKVFSETDTHGDPFCQRACVTSEIETHSLQTNIPTTGADGKTQILDVNGDTLGDVVVAVGSGLVYFKNLGNGDFAPSQPLITLPSNSTVNNFGERAISQTANVKNASSVDVNGDGRSDILLLDKVTVSRCTNSRGGFVPGVGSRNECENDAGGTWSVRTDYKWHLYVSTGGTNYTLQQSVPTTSSFEPRIADLNGDGLTDIMWRASNNWYYRLSNGIEFLSPQIATNINNNTLTTNDNDTPYVRILDVSRDGRTDLLLPNAGASSWNVYFARSIPEHPEKVIFETRGNFPFDKNKTIQFGDVNGDGKVDLLQSNGNWYVGYGGLVGQAEDVIDVIDNGFGVKTRLTYSNITSSDVYYAKESTQGFDTDGKPLDNLVAPKSGYFVVSQAWTDTNNGAANSIKYQYGGLLIDKMGRGMLGFERLRTLDMQTCLTKTVQSEGDEYGDVEFSEVTDDDTCITTETVYSQVFPFIGMPLRTEQRIGLGGALLSRSVSSPQALTTVNSGKMPYVQQSIDEGFTISSDFASSSPFSVTTSTFVYDNFGNLSDSSVVEQDVTNSGNYRETTTKNVFTASSKYQRFGRLTASTVTKRLYANNILVQHNDNDGLVSRESSFEYYDNLMIKKETVSPNDSANRIVNTLGYDAYGNKTSTSTAGLSKANTLQIRQSSIKYRERGRFVESTTDTLGFTTEIDVIGTRGLGKGRIISSITTNANGVTQTKNLDEFERVTTTNVTSPGSNDPSLISNTYTRFCSDVNCSNSNAYIRVIKTASGAPEKQTYVDRWGRTIESRVQGFDGQWSVSSQHYDSNGQPSYVYEPSFGSASTFFTEYKYDRLRRVIEEDKPSGKVTREYSGNTSITTNETNLVHKETSNYLGHLSAVVSASPSGAQQTKLVYAYSANDELLTVDVYSGTTKSHTQVINKYNDYGQKVKMTDADKGAWLYEFNAFGELVKQVNSSNQILEQSYDIAGRMVSRKDEDGYTQWYYDGAGQNAEHSRGKLHKISYFKGRASATGLPTHQEEYTYASHGKIVSTDIEIDGESFSITQGYDSFNRPSYTLYPANGFVTQQTYNELGYAHKTINKTPGHREYNTVYQEIIGTNARGQVTMVNYFNGVTQHQDYYDDTGWLSNLNIYETANPQNEIHNLSYTYTAVGNLNSRTHNYAFNSGNYDFSETFGYDDLNRLTSRNRTVGKVGSLGIEIYSYDKLGNIKTKAGVGTFSYNGYKGASKNQLTEVKNNSGIRTHLFEYDNRGNTLLDSKRKFKYTAFDKPFEIEDIATTAKVNFYYGHDRSMYRQTLKADGKTTDTLYVKGLYERVKLPSGITEHKYNVGNIVVTDRSNNDNDTLYLHKDNLGSTVSITDGTGNAVQHFTYDPWGKQTAFEASSSLVAFVSPAVSQGYTGHKMINDLGIIHMKGRVYDPTLGRFLQADPHIQAPHNSQNYNRYSYVLNNPLSYSDPSGFFFDKLFKSVNKLLGDLAPFVSIALTIWAPWGTGFWASVGTGAIAGGIATGSLRGALTGAFTAGMFHGIGTHFEGFADSAGVLSGGVKFAKTLAHGIAGGISSVLNGGKFGHGFASAGFTQAFAGAINGIGGRYGNVTSGKYFDAINRVKRIVAAAVVGGTASQLTGGKFANGAITGAFSRMFNDESHYQKRKNLVKERVSITSSTNEETGSHEYNISGKLCEVISSGCTVEFANKIFNEVNKNDVPFTRDDLREGDHILGLMNDPVRHEQYPSLRKSLNIALDGHTFYPGTVIHSVNFRDGALFYDVTGVGTGTFTNFNNGVGIALFQPGVKRIIWNHGF